MRTYLPVTLSDLRALMTNGECVVSSGYACSPTLLTLLAGEEDDAEYLATSLAASHARTLQSEWTTRVVMTVEMPDRNWLPAAGSPLAGRVDARLLDASFGSPVHPISVQQIVCVHVDGPGSSPDESDDPTDQATDLQWFAPTEISGLLATYPSDAS